ncbi:LysR family transcriptional regulator [Vibrio sp. S4M6]|uniref:LysR family transcriptional regulator n=1 Tax=Vibrio sinus TaxID=2946865 RepID=UPI002029EFEF|nr:LysR family transcriptional regulator [Vibrio sinus]MCL9779915.1 LysR family transcriptional regulator [Vibrio sinus]
MKAQGMDWNDIPFVLAVCEAGTLSGAAKTLGVNHSTVFRRIEGVETKLGITLFERLSSGYMMTPEGEMFFRQALALREGVDRIQRELSGQDSRLEGTLVVTTTDSLLYIFSKAFSAFQEEYPSVELRVLTGSRRLDLVQKEADVALRPTLMPPEHWVGRNLATLSYATYASKGYVKEMRNLTPDKYRWVSLVDELSRSAMSKMTIKLKHQDASRTIASSLMGVYELAVAGLGVTALPCYLGEHCDKLQRVHDKMNEFDSDLWLLAHPDMRRSARVNAFFDFMTPFVRSQLAVSGLVSNSVLLT